MILISKVHYISIPMACGVNFRVQDTRGGELYSCQIFVNQAVWLILLPNLDTAVGKYAENNEHTDFYVENLVPNQGKTP